MHKKFFVDCVRCGYCCGYRRQSRFGGCAYASDEQVPDGIVAIENEEGEFGIPVDGEDTCIYLVKLDNGFTECSIQDKKPRVCKLFCCLTEQKIRQLGALIDDLRARCVR